MPRTYEPIASQTLGSDTASVEFTGIGSGYTDLVLVLFTRSTNTTTGSSSIGLRIGNGSVDTGSNYSTTYLQGNGSAASSSRLSSQTEAFVGQHYRGSGSTTTFGINVVHIMSYANTNVFKTILSGGGPANDILVRNVSLWRSTSAVTNVLVRNLAGSDSLGSGSVLSLYGVKAA